MSAHSKYIVLNYHGIADYVTGSGGEFTVRPDDFQRQLDLIRELRLPLYIAGQPPGDLHEDTGVALTFDDGNETDFTVTVPALKSRDMKATFFPVVNEISKPGKLNAAQVKLLVEEGFQVGSHGMTHRELTILNEIEQQLELTESLVALEKMTANKIRAFAFPFGTYTDSIIHLTEDAGYSCAMTTEVALNDAADDNFLIHRWNIKRNTTLEEFASMISGKGEIPWAAKTKSKLRHFARRMIGTEQVQQLKQFIKPGTHG